MPTSVSALVARLVVAATLIICPQAALAIASCSAQAVGPGDNCGLGKHFASSPEATIIGTQVLTTGSAGVDLPSGALHGAIRISDGPAFGGTGAASASFGSSLLVDFRILGPTGAPSVPTQLLSTLSGSLGASCVWPACEGNLGYRVRLDSVSFGGFMAQSTAVTSLTQPWMYSSAAQDGSGRSLEPVAGHTEAPDGGSFVFAFNAAQVLGHTLRATIELSANLHLFGAPDNTLIFADAGHTALFNVLVPTGYSIDAFGVALLTAPLLVPEPPAALLALAGVAVFVLRRRWSRPPVFR